MAGQFERSLLRGVAGPLERSVGSRGAGLTAVYYDRTRQAGSAVTIDVIFNEMVGAMDPFANAVFHVRTSQVSPERNGAIVFDGETWDIVDVRDAKDGTAEVRVMRPELTT